MTTKDLMKQKWNYTNIIGIDSFLAELEKVSDYVMEPPDFLLPNVQMGSANRTINSIVYVSKSYVCEVVFNRGELSFDVVRKGTVANFRAHFSTTTVAVEGQNPIEHKVGNITLYHNFQSFTTELNFVGDEAERSLWYSEVVSAFPAPLLRE